MQQVYRQLIWLEVRQIIIDYLLRKDLMFFPIRLNPSPTLQKVIRLVV